MHLLVRDTSSLDEQAPAQELGHSPAPVVVMSFSDADLGALAGAWTPARPDMRLVPLSRLRHPMSVDLYLEQVVCHARCVVVRLLGGLDYFRYGAEEVAVLCRARGIAVALLPGDAADDTRLRELSTVPPDTWSALDAGFRAGGPAGNALVLAWTAHLAGCGPRPAASAAAMPQHGVHTLDLAAPGAADGRIKSGHDVERSGHDVERSGHDVERSSHDVERLNVEGDEIASSTSSPDLIRGSLARPGLAAIVFYRSHLLSNDIAPIEALTVALHERGFAVGTIYAGSLKAPETAEYVARTLRAWHPSVVLNATAFSARPDRGPSPLDAAGAPVLQLVLSGSGRETWAASSRGLSPTDLAMHVVLPELDGRLLTGAVSFKAEAPPVRALEYARTVHRPDPDGIALAANRAAGWARLAATPRAGRRLAIVLSDYPGIGGQQGHAVGLDSFASVAGLLDLLRNDPAGGYLVTSHGTAELAHALCTAPPSPFMRLCDYARLLRQLPAPLQAAVHHAWGAAEDDPSVCGDSFVLRHLHAGQAVVALQPDRGSAADRRSSYHDPDLPPRHAYVAFHLWLRHRLDVHALLHVGAHGSLEWLPGKAAALSPACWPVALTGGLPVIYPFIVNNPGEAAPAKRRLGAVTLGHLTPPLRRTGHHGAAVALEHLLDEYAAADGLDRRRAARLRRSILEHAESAGLLRECGVRRDGDPDETLARLDAYLCDVKDLQVRDGLHVYGRTPRQIEGDPDLEASAASERRALLAALDGRHVEPGPAGAPTRGRGDVLPTGRNLTTVDPRAVPTRAATALAAGAADALLRRHLSEHGDYPRGLVLDLWGSATMRTGGEDFAIAFHLLGARPVWDDGSARVSGFEVLPIAVLDRPRIDVTLRISGLFRDAFAAQVALFDALVRAVAARDEAPDWNPLAAGSQAPRALLRVYGPAPGQYGAGDATGPGWLAASAAAYGRDHHGTADLAGLERRVAAADAFVHTQDHAEHDLLDSPDWAAHEGGFAQAAAALGAEPALYHLDTSVPETPRPRTVAEEVARVVRGRAANPAWIAGMMRHGRAGAAEIARPLAALSAYARSLPARFDAQFDLLHAVTLGDNTVDAFLRAHNPEARADLLARFAEAQRSGLWHPRRNAAAGDGDAPQ